MNRSEIEEQHIPGADLSISENTPLPGSLKAFATQLPGNAAASEASPALESKSKRVDQAYDEYCRERDLGHPVDPDSFCARFPSMRSALGRLLQVHKFLEENAHLVADEPEVLWPQAGKSFLDFDLKLELGKGAFARVYLATEPKLGNRLVAVKVAMHGAAEAEILGRIKHPNIVPVHSVQEDKATGFTAICMPYVGAATLCDVLDAAFPPKCKPPARASVILDAVTNLPFPLDPGQPLSVEPLLRKGAFTDGVRLLGARLANALAFIHDRGICHCDLKPSNVLMTPEGVPMLLDFNLSADARASHNRLGGTILYMSPEQLHATQILDSAGEDAMDQRSDIYSLGVVLYEMATGTHPFVPTPLKKSSSEIRQVLLARQPKGPTAAHLVNPNIDRGLSLCIQRCLEVAPEKRPQTAAELASILQTGLNPVARTRRWVQRNPFKILTACLLVAALTLGVAALAAMRAPYTERQAEAGQAAYKDGRYQESVLLFNTALETDPDNHIARFSRARAHQKLGDFNLAMQGYLEGDQRKPNGRNKAAMGYAVNRTNGKPEVAILWYNEAIKSGFSNAEIHNNLGVNYLRTGKLREAKDNLDQAIRLDDRLQMAYENRARYWISAAMKKMSNLKVGAESFGDLQSGIKDAQKAMTLGIASADLYFDAARLCALASQVESPWHKIGLDYLGKSLEQGLNPSRCDDPALASLRSDPRFLALANRPAPPKSIPTPRFVDPNRDPS
jgi:serine/threonine protein kinase/Tfp pilus assembly protein PilF